MHQFVAVLVLLGCLATSTSAVLASGAGACSYLDRELVKQVSGPIEDYVLDLPPEEEPAGTGTACFYADIILQIDALTPAFIEQTGASGIGGWTALSGAGDSAFFRNAGDNSAEAMGKVGQRSYTIQIRVPQGTSAEAMKANVITLANAIAVKLE